MNEKEKNDLENEPTLLDVFKLGDRVRQVYIGPQGNKYEYKGTIIDIKNHCMAIHWEIINGKPASDLRDIYSIYHKAEIFNGDRCYSPIEKDA